MNLSDDLKKILQNQNGVALMMIMTAIIILMAVYGEFTFDSKVARLKATNILDKSQSKLLAESGLQMAVTRLKLYKEAYNAVQNNPSIKSMVKDQLLNQLWEIPFIYPFPVGSDANSGLKDSVDKFSKESLLDGEMKVTIQNISNRMNLNMLRVDLTKISAEGNDQREYSSALNVSDNAIMTDVSVDQSLFYLLKRLVDEKKEKDESFNDKYASISYQEMITALKFFVSDVGSMTQDPQADFVESMFQRIPMTPKYGPLSSSSELFAIPGWNDELIELIQNEFSVYPTAQIDFNKLTSNMLRILIPTIGEEEIKEFFIWRDDPNDPKYINNESDFKRYIVDQERLMSETDFDDRIKLFKDSGVTFGSNPSLFKVISEGKYNRSIYTLVAYVVLPKNMATTSGATNSRKQGDPNNPESTTPGEGTSTQNTTNNNTEDQKTQLMDPKILEIQIN
jgi:hypothetical protein